MSRSSWTGSHNRQARNVGKMNGVRPWSKSRRTDKKDRQWGKTLSSGRVEA